MPQVRLEPSDEFTHPVDDAPNFNESMYFNTYDPAQQLGAFFRIGNRPNEGYAETTACVYLPDGRVGFWFGRPPIASNDALDAGGMRFDVSVPFESLRVTYDGPVVVLDDPLQMEDPKRAFTQNPHEACRARLDFRGVSPMFGGEPAGDGEPAGVTAGFARAHYEQHVGARGTIQVGDAEWGIDGYGLRDHSWGRRYWQAPWWYRWLNAAFGDEFGFMISVIATREGERRIGGMVLTDGRYDPIEDASVETEWTGGFYQRVIRATARTAQRTYEIEGRVRSLIPLRNRRRGDDGEMLVTRITEGLTEWRCDGRVGYGLAEYLDQMVDGRPAGAT